MNYDRMRELFREMRDEPVPADSLARVRAKLAERTGRRSWFRWWVPVLVAGLAILAVVLRPAGTPPPPVVLVQRAAPPPTPAPAVRPRPRSVPRPQPRVVAGTVIRIDTPDPDVVIFLVGD